MARRVYATVVNAGNNTDGYKEQGERSGVGILGYLIINNSIGIPAGAVVRLRMMSTDNDIVGGTQSFTWYR